MLPAIVWIGCEPRTDGLVDASEATESPDPVATALASTQPRGGVFAMRADHVETDPVDCRRGPPGNWSFELPTAVQTGWRGTERFNQHNTPYACSGSADAFECTARPGFDYAVTGIDANVELVVTYAGAWTDVDTIAGNFDLLFTCTGAQCSRVSEQWTVSAFPCANSGRFEGSLQ